MALAATPGDRRVQQVLDIDAVGLHPPRPAVDPQAGRLHDRTFDATVLEEARQPEAVVAGLVARRQAAVRLCRGDRAQGHGSDANGDAVRQKLAKIGAKVVRHRRYITFRLAEAAIARSLFAEILGLSDGLRPVPLPS